MARAAAAPLASLDELARLHPDQLWPLYLRARTPGLADLDGATQGRMLAVPRADGRVMHALLATKARSRIFPWQGKTFQASDPGHGEGINRLLGNRANWFRFTTSIGPSRAGDFDAFQLDYDHPGNPGLVRRIKDEVREVAPGLWLGLAYVLFRGKPHLGLYFGLQRSTATPE